MNYEVIVSPKMPTKNSRAEILQIFGWHFGGNDDLIIHSEFNWPLKTPETPPETIFQIVQELWHFVWTWSKISEENSCSKFLRAAPAAGSAHHEGFQLQPSCDEKCQGIQEITSRGSQGTTQYHPWSAFGTWTTGKCQVFLFNRSSWRKRGMASNPLFIIPDFCIFQMNLAMA